MCHTKYRVMTLHKKFHMLVLMSKEGKQYKKKLADLQVSSSCGKNWNFSDFTKFFGVFFFTLPNPYLQTVALTRCPNKANCILEFFALIKA